MKVDFVQGLSLACLVVLLLCQFFFVQVDFVQGLLLACVVGLLLFLKWDFFHWVSSLLVVCGCQFFLRSWIFQGLSPTKQASDRP